MGYLLWGPSLPGDQNRVESVAVGEEREWHGIGPCRGGFGVASDPKTH